MRTLAHIDSDIATLARQHDELRSAVADLLAHLTLRRVVCELADFSDWLERHYRPNQPRAPRGTPIGGQWIVDPTSARQRELARQRLAQGDPLAGYPVDLRAEEARGGHTINMHVAKSPEFLLRRVRQGRIEGIAFSIVLYRAGSFSSLFSATKLVNATIVRNRPIVDRVASGELADAFVTATFAQQTGIEAFLPSETASPHIRDTYGVGVAIVHDPSSANGYTVVTAYPPQD